MSQEQIFSNDNEIKRLLASWSNGELSEELSDRLNELLTNSAEARTYYLEYAATEAELYATHVSLSPHAAKNRNQSRDKSERSYSANSLMGVSDNQDLISLDCLEGAFKPSGVEFNESEGSGTLLGDFTARAQQSSLMSNANSIGHQRRRSWWHQTTEAIQSIGKVAAVVLLAVTIGYLASSQKANPTVADLSITPDAQSSESDSSIAIVEEPVGPRVATVTATRNCRWANPTLSVGYGTELFAGQTLELQAGIAEISFQDGGRIILEGPASLDLDTEAESVLHRGRLAASLPAGCGKIPVRTPRLAVLPASHQDLSNSNSDVQFGLSADISGAEEVHVFSGQLETYLRGVEGHHRSNAIKLVSQEAARLRPASTTVAKFYADDDKFVRSISATGGPHDGLLAYEPFDYSAGPLSGQNGGFGWAGAWADIEAACPPGQLATNVAVEGNMRYKKMRAIGGHSMQVAQQNRIRRALSTSLGGVFDSMGLVENQDGHRLVGANGKTIYIGFLQSVNNTDGTFYGFELHRGDGNKNRVLCIGNGAEGAGYGVTSNFNSYGKQNYKSLGEENNQVNYMVVRISYGTLNGDRVDVYRNPSSLTQINKQKPTATLYGNFAFDRISFGNFDGYKQHGIDEVRIGTTYRAVTGLRDRHDERLIPRFASNENPQLQASNLLLAANNTKQLFKQE